MQKSCQNHVKIMPKTCPERLKNMPKHPQMMPNSSQKHPRIIGVFYVFDHDHWWSSSISSIDHPRRASSLVIIDQHWSSATIIAAHHRSSITLDHGWSKTIVAAVYIVQGAALTPAARNHFSGHVISTPVGWAQTGPRHGIDRCENRGLEAAKEVSRNVQKLGSAHCP